MLYKVDYSPWVRGHMHIWKDLTEGRKPVPFKKNMALFHQGEPAQFFYIVESGSIRITFYQKDGAEKQICMVEHGALLGEAACIMEKVHLTTAVAAVDSAVYIIPWHEAKQKMKDNWDLNQSVTMTLCRKEFILFYQVMALSFSDAMQRIAQVLINLAHEYGVTTEAGLLIPVRFTQQDIANLTSLSRVTVSNILNYFAAREILTRDSGHFVLHDLEMLQQFADGSCDNGNYL